jgi:dTDP-4-amino-4,6-dideoxygalactose transaminase
MLQISLIRPAPPPLSQATRALRQIEQSGVFSNFGPVNTAFEHDLVQSLFDGTGYCTTVANATLGLMLAVREAMETCPRPGARYALMPAFTFAAAGHAALWCGLTPLFCDINARDWAADAGAEAALLAQYGDEIAVIMPYATFGYAIDLARYKAVSAQYGIPVVVDAAASLGTKSARGRGFGAGSQIPLVFSMHATKSFATGEGGVIYSADKALIGRLRQMSNFGFGTQRAASMPGLNAKLSEVGALQGRLRLQGYELVVARRQRLVNAYRQVLPELGFQPMPRTAQAHQFLPALLPPGYGARRDDIQAGMAARGVGLGRYFSPHLAEQSYFAATAMAGALPVTEEVAGRIISLPLYDGMSELEMYEVVAALKLCLAPAAAQMMRSAAE